MDGFSMFVGGVIVVVVLLAGSLVTAVADSMATARVVKSCLTYGSFEVLTSTYNCTKRSSKE